MKLITICNFVLYNYLLKVADMAEKWYYLHALCTAARGVHMSMSFKDLMTFLDNLHELKVFDLHRDSVFQLYDIHVLLTPLSQQPSVLSDDSLKIWKNPQSISFVEYYTYDGTEIRMIQQADLSEIKYNVG